MTVAEINKLIQELPSEERGKVSDGYHDFNELYKHRDQLWIKLAEWLSSPADINSPIVWRSLKHFDGSSYKDLFVLGSSREDGSNQITYHLPISKWNECNFARTYDKAPKWDGHTSKNVLSRLKLL